MNEKNDTLRPDPCEDLGKIQEGRLWAPWRMKYIEAASRGEETGCFLCENPRQPDGEENLVLYRGRHCFVIMNLYPYNNGHLMVAPYRHVGDLAELTPEELQEGAAQVQLCVEVLREVMHPHGFNIGANLGRVAGAGVEDHLHLHIVPRWSGDTNFMPVVADTKVVSESLHEGWRRLKTAFESKI
ncbi:MAG: HIT domain-containing protein [Candidatus Zixiibacteriota bacterium]|nr:MAG: HIT domain-containing protein [candidate division Zixibacteria bacterium]